MRKLKFYAKLAGQSLIKNRKFYLPYLICCICVSAMFYIMTYLTDNKGLYQMPGTEYVQFVLTTGCFIIAMFGGIVLFYANSFLIKRRKKELGLYNILGMQKKNIACVMLWETMYSAFVGIAGGVLTGILFSKLVLLLLCQLLKTNIPFGFEISTNGVASTVVVFLFIFFLNLLTNLRYVRKAQPVEMLRAANSAEKEPKSKWPLTVLGILNLGLGYGIALWAPSPVVALVVFFIAVTFVIIGTYCLFISGSIVILKILRRNKKYYYTTKHFTTVSGMLHRMKKNAAGLASVCILSTMVLVTVSCTVCLYAGENDYIRTRYPSDILVYLYDSDDATVELMKKEITKTAADENITVEEIKESPELDFSVLNVNQDMSVLNRFGRYVADDFDCFLFQLTTEEDYEMKTGKEIDLHNGEILTQVFQSGATIPDALQLIGIDYKNTQINDYPLCGSVSVYAAQIACGVVTKEDYEMISHELRLQEEEMIANGDNITTSSCKRIIGVDVDCEDSLESGFNATLMERLSFVPDVTYSQMFTECRADSMVSFNAMYGGFFFMGIFLGTMFLMATVLIIYYKQISEGYEDAERFKIMQRVGMSQKEVKASIHSQILTVFFLPLIMAGIHILFAFSMLVKLLTIFSLYNVGLFAVCCLSTFIIFAAVYILIYTTTAKSYYQIVKE